MIGLRSHVGRRSNIESLHDLLSSDDLAVAEVDDYWIHILSQNYVRRLEISMDDAVLSERVAADQYLLEDLECLSLWNFRFLSNVILQGPALAKLSHNVAEAILLHDVKKLNHMLILD